MTWFSLTKKHFPSERVEEREREKEREYKIKKGVYII